MRIQSINPSMSVNSCQPIKQVEFARKKSPEVELSSVLKQDVFDEEIKQDSYTIDQKYNLACLLAAYYKTQYEQLAKQNGCLA